MEEEDVESDNPQWGEKAPPLFTPVGRPARCILAWDFSRFKSDEGSVWDVMLRKRVLELKRQMKEVMWRMEKAEADMHMLKAENVKP